MPELQRRNEKRIQRASRYIQRPRLLFDRGEKMKLLVLAPFNIIPPNFGGAERIFNLAKRLEPCTVIALNWEGVDQEGQYQNIYYRLIGADDTAREQSTKLLKLGVQTYDGMPFFTRKNQTKLRSAIEEQKADLIVLEHPWLIPFVGDTPFIYDAHNSEAILTAARWPNSIDAQVVYELEREAVTKAQAIAVCSEEDAKNLAGLYKTTKPMHLIPNGTDIPSERSKGETKNLLFIGSLYGPNIRAAQELADLANQLPDYTIQIVGGCSQAVVTDAPNVQLLGLVTEEKKNELFINAYAFVNLMLQGSGTNLKNARAMAYGLPVIATSIGARGFPTAIQVSNAQGVIDALEKMTWGVESDRSRRFAEEINWDTVGDAYRQLVQDTYAKLQ
jgi:glycosyltransferase involved in cell wall biosynthesis